MLLEFTSAELFNPGSPFPRGENCREIFLESIEDLETGLERVAQFPTGGLRKFKRLQPTAGELLRRSSNFRAFRPAS